MITLVAVGVLFVIVLALTVLCVRSDRACARTENALEHAVLEAAARERALSADVARLRAERDELARRQRVTIRHARGVRAELQATEEQRALLCDLSTDIARQRDAARSEAARARLEQVVLPKDCARSPGGDA